MKNFKTILTTLRIVVTLLFAANVIFMFQLYSSIKERYVSDVEQSISRADQIEMVDRIVKAGLAATNEVVWLQIGLQKSDVGTTIDAELLKEMNYSQGFRRVDKQLMTYIAEYLHDSYGDQTGKPDIQKLEEALRRDLAFSGYYPEEVYITLPEETPEFQNGLWKIEYRINGSLIYNAYISPLTENILWEMSGVIATSVLIALVLTFGFWYLLHVINRQRTLEEMKDDFTNNMTHELKTPIAIAYAANDSLLHFPDPTDDNRTKRYLSAALEQLSKLSGLVEQILSMSMERRKNLILTKEKILLKPFLTAVIEQQKLKASKPCIITMSCSDDLVVETDPIHFSNIIGNLIDNSIKYSGESVEIHIEADNNGISVKDNGIGIPEKSLSEVFNKFYRVPNGNRTDVRGYGIGLFYVKSIVEKHGWTISVKSKVKEGSRFIINFKRI